MLIPFLDLQNCNSHLFILHTSKRYYCKIKILFFLKQPSLKKMFKYCLETNWDPPIDYILKGSYSSSLFIDKGQK